MLSLQNDAGATGSSSAEVVVNMLLKTRGDSSSDVARTYDRMWAIWRASTGVAATYAWHLWVSGRLGHMVVGDGS